MSNLKIGDKVITESGPVVRTVRSEPFTLCGKVCVLLEGISGGYPVDNLTKVVAEG